jgi:hypothetical protein
MKKSVGLSLLLAIPLGIGVGEMLRSEAGDRIPAPDRSESRIREDDIKFEAVERLESVPHTGGLVHAGSLQLADTTVDIPVSVTANNDGVVFILDSAGGVFSTRLNGGVIETPQPVPVPTLLGATSVRTDGGGLVIRDRRGIHRVDLANRTSKAVRTFYVGGPLAVGSNGGFILMPPTKALEPLIQEFDASGALIRAYGTRESGPYGTVVNSAVLERCGDAVVLGMRFRGRLRLFTDAREAAGSAVPMPGHKGLEELEATRSLVNPRPGVYALPTYVTGIACDDADTLVVVDTPRPLIHRFSRSGELKESFAGADAIHGRHFRGLAVARQQDEILVYTVSADADKTYRLMALRLSPRRRTLV